MLDLALLLATTAAVVLCAEPNPPRWPPNVHIFGEDSEGINSTVQSLYFSQRQDLYDSRRQAFLFKPGTYTTDIPVGYYTTGKKPITIRLYAPILQLAAACLVSSLLATSSLFTSAGTRYLLTLRLCCCSLPHSTPLLVLTTSSVCCSLPVVTASWVRCSLPARCPAHCLCNQCTDWGLTQPTFHSLDDSAYISQSPVAI